jgi:hypothetical protein
VTREAEAPKITRADIEAKLAEIRGEVDTVTRQALDKAKVGGVAAAVLLALLLYFLGRRGGKKKTTIVEIRRV